MDAEIHLNSALGNLCENGPIYVDTAKSVVFRNFATDAYPIVNGNGGVAYLKNVEHFEASDCLFSGGSATYGIGVGLQYNWYCIMPNMNM